MYLRSEKLARFFEEVTQGEKDKPFIKTISNYIANDMVKIIRDIGIRDTDNKEISDIRVPISAENFKYILALLKQNRLSSRAVKDVLLESVTNGRDPREIIEAKGLLVEHTEGDIQAVVSKIISENPAAVEEFKSGKSNALEFLVGKCMKEFKGSGNPVTLRGTLMDLLSRQ